MEGERGVWIDNNGIFVQVPIELKMLLRANFHKGGGKSAEMAEPAEVRHLQEAVTNYLTVSQVLWPFDYGPLVILRILVENRWGAAAGAEMKDRVNLVSRFFNEVVSDNSGRAVHGEPPLEYEKARAKWTRLVEMSSPQPGFAYPAAAGGAKAINCGNRAADGKRLGKKLSALELLGPLVVVAAAPEICRGQPVRVWVDNAGSVRIWEKGYSSSCRLCTTVVKAAATVAAALRCRLEVVKIRRCSNLGAVMADALSQGDFRRFRAAAVGVQPTAVPATVPPAIGRWLARPVADNDLGQRILRDMAVAGTALMGYS